MPSTRSTDTLFQQPVLRCSNATVPGPAIDETLETLEDSHSTFGPVKTKCRPFAVEASSKAQPPTLW